MPERSGGAGATPQRIVFMASRQAVYQCLSQAAQRHFTMFEVSLLDHLSSAEMPDSSVRLVLVSHGDGWTSASNVRECRRRFPAAAIGLVVERGTQELDVTLMDHQLVQGILPLTLPLDVWLAIASLLVAGGEYLSQDGAFHRDVQREWAVPPAEAARVAGPVLRAADQAAALGLESLTARERQILQLVSEGYQNKLIADRMALSEHTVKAHVHNLIAKLRVTNRTQAAAAFLQEHLSRTPRGPVAMRER